MRDKVDKQGPSQSDPLLRSTEEGAKIEADGKPFLRTLYDAFGKASIPPEEFGNLNGKLSALSSRFTEILSRERRSAELLRDLLDHSPFPMMLIDERRRVTFATRSARALFGAVADREPRLADLGKLSAHPALMEGITDALQGKPEIRCEVRLGDHSYLCRIAPCPAGAEEKTNALVTLIDLSDDLAARAQTPPGADHAAAEDPQLLAASRNLRQPLQALMLVQAFFAKRSDEADRTLAAGLGRSILAMKAVVDAVEDLRRLKNGLVRATICDFPLAPFLAELRSDFVPAMRDCDIDWRVMPCAVTIRSDPRLLRRMIEALLFEAIKEGRKGKLLLGCRRSGATARLEIWRTNNVVDSAVGDDPATFALGLGVAKRLATLLHHRLEIRPRRDAGLLASIELDVGSDAAVIPVSVRRSKRAVLVVSEDPPLLCLLHDLLSLEGHQVAAVADGRQAVSLLSGDKARFRPELVVVDQRAPGFRGGAELIYRLREKLGGEIPALILVPEASDDDKHRADQHGCLLLRKPVAIPELLKLIERGFPRRPMSVARQRRNAGGRVEQTARACILVGNELHGWRPDPSLWPGGLSTIWWSSGEEFLATEPEPTCLCLIVDVDLPGIDGIGLLERIRQEGRQEPAILLVNVGDVATAVRAAKAGAAEVLEKPIDKEGLALAVRNAAASAKLRAGQSSRRQEAVFRIRDLTHRQREVLGLMLEGRPNKDIAARLGISLRTVESHRAAVMHRTGSHSLVDLMRVVQAAGGDHRGLRR